MNLPYIINVAVILLACLAFYKLLLRRETFYKVNRYMLILCLVISFALPLLQVPQQFSFRKPATNAVIQQPTLIVTEQAQQSPSNVKQDARNAAATNNASQPVATNADKAEKSGFSFAQLMTWLFWIYWFGVIVFGVSFLFQLVLLLVRAYRNPVIIDGPYRIVEVSGDKAPCSFGNNIFINPEKYEWETYNQIILHEKIHISQKHTVDIMIAELLLIFQWFNPFAWIYRREIESNLEFLTDDQLMQQKIDKQSYQLSLVKVSTPHLPLSLTTNYNQSILKKRIAMMNTKRSNLHTAWKYFFLLPVFAFLACLLNEPAAKAQESQKVGKSEKSGKDDNNEKKNLRGMQSEGYWFAVIKGDKVHIRFSDEKLDSENDYKGKHSYSGEDFKLSELGTLPKGTSGTFSITREAGTMQMTGRFEDNTGMGTYKFDANKSYVDYMNKELKETLDDDDQLAFFFINIKKEYLTMLRSEGFKDVTKDDLIPVAALGIDKAYISSIRSAGFKDVTLEELVPLKALGIDSKYITEIRSAGYKDISSDQLVSFKAQGIDKKYIESVRQMKGDKGEKGDKGDKGGKDNDADDIVSFKAMNITPEYINSFKAVGMTNIPHDQLVAFKAVGVTPEYVKGWYNLGYKNIDPEDFVGMKSQNVTPEFMKSFADMGYKVKPEDLVAFRALGINTDYIKSFKAAGYKIEDLDNLTGLKAQGITPEYIKSFESVGFKDIDLDEIVAVKAVGVTPEYIKEMKSKGFNYDKIQKYVTLKSID